MLGGIVVVCALIGAGIAVVVGGPAALRVSGVAQTPAPASSVRAAPTTVVAAVKIPPVDAPQPALAASTPTSVPSTPTSAPSTPTSAPSTPTSAPSTPTSAPAAAATATVQPTPTVAEAWATVQPEIESVWGSDTPRTVALLDGFLARFPDYPPAREKLYAALISSGVELVRAGETEAANQRFEQAQALLPERGEAAAARQALTPTPTQTPAPQAPDPPRAQPAPPASTLVRPQPAPPAPPVVVSRPTPTKQPFSPPRG